MLAKSISALAALAFAAHAVVAEPMPYKPTVVKMSVRELFGVVRRANVPGYQPTPAVCGEGDTCEAACGAGFTTCASKDEAIHCFNSAAAQTCCPDNSGNSCDAGYFCAADATNETWCCPDGMNLEQCAAAYSITGGLVRETASATSLSSSAAPSTTSFSSSAPATTSSSSISSSSSASVDKNATTTASASEETLSTVEPTSSFLPSGGFSSSNTTSISFVTTGSAPAPTTTATQVATAAGSRVVPAGALLLLVAGIASLL
ncbi:hypothetical protein B0T17DRAFT_615694 [Bombardia bombarda]|uniref:Uncharacterized protein n=1 Tax=Bombardia bombarda TaxID=252184 RepID=A0AA40C9C8_9PEZI|nr:hypothetical protein B0T17DRAFT_615694 [Bombardia bombarda]